MSRSATFVILAASLFGACNRAEQATAEARPAAKAAAKPKAEKAAGEKAAKGEKAEKGEKGKHAEAEHSDGPQKFVVPFAWEASRDEPLAQARSFLKEILSDNRLYMEHGPKFFASFADGQKPRATVVTCSDSRVHTTAFDTTPENDDFMIRNIGNQIDNGLGSVEYGVEHLQTPVLMILGHSGCGAVKAALGDISSQSEPVRLELEKLRVSKPKAGATADAAWAAAVVENVHNQVAVALGHFGERVQEGKLTVIGAVYDFRNDYGKGSGKLTIVDVNGNGEEDRMAAFVEAIESAEGGGSAAPKRREVPRGRRASAAAGRDDGEVPAALKEAIQRAKELTTASHSK